MNIPDKKELEARAYAYCQDRNIKVVYNDQDELFAAFAAEEISKVRQAIVKEIMSCINDNETLQDLRVDLGDLIDQIAWDKPANAETVPTQEISGE